MLLTPVGMLMFASIISGIVLASLVVDSLLHLPRIIPERPRLCVSLPVIAAGMGVSVWSVWCFFMAKGTPVPFNPPPRLVTEGPYRYSRNPMLSGVFIVLFGAGLWLNSLSLMFFFTPLFVFICIWGIKRFEEPELIKRLGDEYIEYKRKTPMFFPYFTKFFFTNKRN